MKPGKLEAVLGVALALLLVSGQATGQSAAGNVIKLRSASVGLYDKPNGIKIADFPRDQFRGRWKIVGAPKEGFVNVEVEGRPVWVKSYAVESDNRVVANSECGAIVASAQPKAAATRGLGEECRP